MIKKYIEERFRVVNYLQVGTETEGKFTGIVLNNSVLWYVNGNELVILNEENKLEDYLKANPDYDKLLKEITEAMDSYSIIFDKKIRKFIITDAEKFKENFEKNDSEVVLKEKFITNGFSKEKIDFKAELFVNRSLLIFNDLLTTLEILKANDEAKYQEMLKVLGFQEAKKGE